MDQGAIRRKLAAGRAPAPAEVAGVERGWRMALARGARDALALRLEVTSLALGRRSLTELLELPPPRALIAVLEGPGEALGLLVLSPTVLAAMIEVQTMGRVSPAPAASRKPTRTDAAMVAGFIDRALADLDAGLQADPDLVWAGGFRYASFLEDARPLALLLEDAAYRVAEAAVDLGDGAKSGAILLALPADGRGRRPAPPAAPRTEPPPEQVFAEALTQQVMQVDCVLQAVLTRITLPLSAVMAAQPGDVLPLPFASLDRVAFEGMDGRRLGEGRLGQNRGMRAVRLAPAAADPQAPVLLRPAGS
jgi:flagellar motor switch protein FliM